MDTTLYYLRQINNIQFEKKLSNCQQLALLKAFKKIQIRKIHPQIPITLNIKKIDTPDQTFFLQASNNQDKDAWIEPVGKAIKQNLKINRNDDD